MANEQLCCCHNVTLEDVKEEINKGVKTFKTLQENTGIGTDCPPCEKNNRALFEKLLQE